MGTIYILENKIDGKCYVGQTCRLFKTRFKQHQNSHSLIGVALREYSINNFKKILIEDIPEEKLDDLEREYIQKYNSISPNGYNLDSGGHKNKHHCEETIKKISKATEGEKNHNFGKQFTERHKKKLSEAAKGEKNHNYGKRPSEETIKKISKTEKGKFVSKETRKKMSEAHKIKPSNMKGKHHSIETKQKMSEAHKGKPRSIETKQKISKTHKDKFLAREIKKKINDIENI
jgi:group I intron endonuclease